MLFDTHVEFILVISASTFNCLTVIYMLHQLHTKCEIFLSSYRKNILRFDIIVMFVIEYIQDSVTYITFVFCTTHF